MRITNYYYLFKGWEGNIAIYQYMDLDYLFSLLERKQYYINRRYHFEDRCESVLPSKSLFGFNTYGTLLNEEEIQKRMEEISNKLDTYKESSYWLTSCWTKDSIESLLMWKNYTTKIGVRTKSSIQNFVASIDSDKYTIVCGHISYDGYLSKPFEECIFSKEKYYKDEREVRFYFIPNDDSDSLPTGVDIPINPLTLIDEIVLSPYIKRRAAEKLTELIKNEYGINNIHPSGIEIK